MEKGCAKLSTAMTGVRLAEVFSRDLIVLGLKQHTKHGAIAELVRRLIDAGRVEAASESALVRLIMAREEMGSTAMGNGIAMPHCRTTVVEQFVGVVGIDTKGIDFSALDRLPVHLVFLLLGPLEQREQHFDILGRISRLRQEKTIRTQLRGCRSTSDVLAILGELDSCDG
jgi:mannitol/fructose-specific phosphotransferase system IIA component (Ntr-type)